ncbi:hypothetical protein H4R35_000068 [Dimargaris xerosporica]|nr:hypothetical protein H4R35_000068 [Dimargaris xerosporica]
MASSVPASIGRVADAFELFQKKVYHSGVLYKKNVTNTDGRPFSVKAWTPWYVELVGPVLVFWGLADVPAQSVDLLRSTPTAANAQDLLAQIKHSVTPNYLNITDGQAHVVGCLKKREGVFSLTSSGANFFYFHAPSPQQMFTWVVAIRLLAFEAAKVYENYTLAYMPHAHLALLQGQQGLPIRQGYLQARFMGSLDWQSFWVVLRPVNSPGSANLLFYPAQQPSGTPVATMTVVHRAYAIYPEQIDLVDVATIAKLEGKFTAHEPDAISLATSLHFALIMTGSSQELFTWLTALFNAFQLYGRPTSLQAPRPFDPQHLFLDATDEVVRAVQVEGTQAHDTHQVFDELFEETYGPPQYTAIQSTHSPILPRASELVSPPATTMTPSMASDQPKPPRRALLASSSESDTETETDAPGARGLDPAAPMLSLPRSDSGLMDVHEKMDELSHRISKVHLDPRHTPASASSSTSSAGRSPLSAEITSPQPKTKPAANAKKYAPTRSLGRAKGARPVASDSSDGRNSGSSSDSDAPPPRARPKQPSAANGRVASTYGLRSTSADVLTDLNRRPQSGFDLPPPPSLNDNNRRHSSGTSSSSHLSWGRLNPQSQAALAHDGFDQAAGAPPPVQAPFGMPPGMAPTPNGQMSPGSRQSYMPVQQPYGMPPNGQFFHPAPMPMEGYAPGYPAMMNPMSMYDPQFYPEDYLDHQSQMGGSEYGGARPGLRSRQQPLTLMAAHEADRWQQQQLLQRTGPLLQIDKKKEPVKGGLVGAIAARQQQKADKKYTDASSYLRSALRQQAHHGSPMATPSGMASPGPYSGMAYAGSDYSSAGSGQPPMYPHMAGRSFSHGGPYAGAPMTIPDGEDDDDDVPLGLVPAGSNGMGGMPPMAPGLRNRTHSMYGGPNPSSFQPPSVMRANSDDDTDHTSLAALAAGRGQRHSFNSSNGIRRPESQFMGNGLNGPGSPHSMSGDMGGYLPTTASRRGAANSVHRNSSFPLSSGQGLYNQFSPPGSVAMRSPLASTDDVASMANKRISSARTLDPYGNARAPPASTSGYSPRANPRLSDGDHSTADSDSQDDAGDIDVDDLPEGLLKHFSKFMDKHIEIKPYSSVHPTALYNAYAASCHMERLQPQFTATKKQLTALMLDNGFSKRKVKKSEHLGEQWCDIVLTQ